MISWISNRIVWFISRLMITLACILTVYHLINQTTPYKVSFDLLVIVSACVIIAVRFWIPTCNCHKKGENEKE